MNVMLLILLSVCSLLEGISVSQLTALRTAKQNVENLIKKYASSEKSSWYTAFEKELAIIAPLDKDAVAMFRNRVPVQKIVSKPTIIDPFYAKVVVPEKVNQDVVQEKKMPIAIVQGKIKTSVQEVGLDSKKTIQDVELQKNQESDEPVAQPLQEQELINFPEIVFQKEELPNEQPVSTEEDIERLVEEKQQAVQERKAVEDQRRLEEERREQVRLEEQKRQEKEKAAQQKQKEEAEKILQQQEQQKILEAEKNKLEKMFNKASMSFGQEIKKVFNQQKQEPLVAKSIESLFESIDNLRTQIKKTKAKEIKKEFSQKNDQRQAQLIEKLFEHIQGALTLIQAKIEPIKNTLIDNETKIVNGGSNSTEFNALSYQFFFGPFDKDEWKNKNKRKTFGWFSIPYVVISKSLHEINVCGNQWLGRLETQLKPGTGVQLNQLKSLQNILKPIHELLSSYKKSLSQAYNGMQEAQKVKSSDIQDKQDNLIESDYQSHLKAIDQGEKNIKNIIDRITALQGVQAQDFAAFGNF